MTIQENVKDFDINVGITISEYDGRYEWWASNGMESDELFDSVDEAEEDARGRFE